MYIVKLLLYLILTSISPEWVFSKLDLVHTKLCNNSSNERTSYLVILSSSSEMLETINLIKLYNKLFK